MLSCARGLHKNANTIGAGSVGCRMTAAPSTCFNQPDDRLVTITGQPSRSPTNIADGTIPAARRRRFRGARATIARQSAAVRPLDLFGSRGDGRTWMAGGQAKWWAACRLRVSMQ